MVTAVERAGKRLGKAKHLLDNAKVTITTQTASTKGPFTNNDKPKVIVANYPARVVKGGLTSQQQQEFLPDVYDAVLIIDTGISIPAGCAIDAVGLDGATTHYKRATRGYAGYHSHQEVAMVLDSKGVSASQTD